MPIRLDTNEATPVDANHTGAEGEVLAPAYRVEPEKVTEVAPKVREATVEDIDRMDSLTLEDFDVDFGKVQIPEKPPGERLSSEELHSAVDSFLDSLRER